MSRKNKHEHPEDSRTDAASAMNEVAAESVAEAMPANDGPDSSDVSTAAVTASSPEAPEPEKSAGESVEGLKAELKAAADRYLRLMAEFDNYKKRTVREYERMVETANERLMLELIAVRETFELALKHGGNGSDYQQLFEGIKLLFNKFDGVLSANGLTCFAEKGEVFDPLIHDALMKMPHDEVPEDHIADIHEKGYRLKDRVIKHARVIVSSGKSPVPPAVVAESAEAPETGGAE